MTRSSEIYWNHRIEQHVVQYFVAAVLIGHLMNKYPWAWAHRNERKQRDPSQRDAKEFVLLHLGNMRMRASV